MLLKLRASRTLVISSFQCPVPRMCSNDSKLDHKKQPQIAEIVTVISARMVFSRYPSKARQQKGFR